MLALLSINYKRAPIEIREKFAFASDMKLKLLKELYLLEEVEEVLILTTCNRSEIYINTYVDTSVNIAIEKMKNITFRYAKVDMISNMEDYIFIYTGERAIRHIFKVSAGLDSMIMGEDNILGQVKEAYDFAKSAGMCKAYLHTLFRDAITCAKKIKTQTPLSRSALSYATLTFKKAMEVLETCNEKSMILIGASGSMGQSILKNAKKFSFEKIYVTKRTHTFSYIPTEETIELIAYEDRYDYFDKADLIVSVSSSPFYTITKEKLLLRTCIGNKKRVFIDLAVPSDIDPKINGLPDVWLFTIDDMKEVADRNSERKLEGITQAEYIVKEYVEKFIKWSIYAENIDIFEESKYIFEKECKKYGISRAIEHLFYDIRDLGDIDGLRNLAHVLGERKR